ncbi:MAG: isoamylase early set domain-containing protein [Bacteroidia bacterium]
MGITKKTLKSKPVTKVTFKAEKKIVNGAKNVSVVGEFNNWNPEANPMKALKTGGFSTTVELEKGKEYQFRYLLDGEQWINEPKADKEVNTQFVDASNSVVVC